MVSFFKTILNPNDTLNELNVRMSVYRFSENSSNHFFTTTFLHTLLKLNAYTFDDIVDCPILRRLIHRAHGISFFSLYAHFCYFLGVRSFFEQGSKGILFTL